MDERVKEQRKILRELLHEQRYADGEIKKAEKRSNATGAAFNQGYRNGLGFAYRTLLDAWGKP